MSRPIESELSANKQCSNMAIKRYLLARKLSNTLPALLDDLWPTLQHHEMVDPLVCSENKQFHQALESEGKKTTNKHSTKNLQQLEKDGYLHLVSNDHTNFKIVSNSKGSV